MAHFHNNALIGAAGAAGGGGYQISRSLRFNSVDSAYLSRTPGVAGNRKTWTWSGWVKRSGALSNATLYPSLFGAKFGATRDVIRFGNDTTPDIIEVVFASGPGGAVRTQAVFRDVSAWYHIVISVDTTQATASNRARVYVNGSEITQFQSTVYPAQNYDTHFNYNTVHYVGADDLISQSYFSGYLADIHFIDGQALTPSSFGEFDANGEWQPKAYTGTYGTNGFKLNFADDSAATATALGKDTSGNSNNWTPTNFAVAGSNAVTFPAANSPSTVDYLVIGGGGGGGAGNPSVSYGGGGGGAGGLLSGSAYAVTAGATYAVRVGAAGAGASASTVPGVSGGTSIFGAISAVGGGGGGSVQSTAGQPGGSGGGGAGTGNIVGGAGGAGTAGQGYAGGSQFNANSNYGGGGGGAGGVGQNGSVSGSGNGGVGVSSSITGTAVFYAGGGPGSTASGGAGFGAYGGGGQGNVGAPGGNGMAGVVIIRYANTFADLTIGSGLTYSLTNTGGFKIYTITASSDAVVVGNDSLVDTPTSYGLDTGVGGEVRGNYCTLNPLIATGSTLSNGNLDYASTASYQAAFGTFGVRTGKWYFEGTVGTFAIDALIGVSSAPFSTTTYVGGTATSWGYEGAVGRMYNNASFSAYGATFGAGDVIGVAFDADTGKLWFAKNGIWQASGNPATGANPAVTLTTGIDYLFGVSAGNSGTWWCNWGARPFAYTAPSGFKALCDTNLPAPTIVKPSTVMDVVTYTGTGASLTPTSSLGFSPDLAWIKGRSGATDHALYDTVRGATLDLVSNSTAAETTQAQGLTAFNSNGFTVGTLAKVNTSAATYAAWCWDAGSSTVTNTSGTISSQVRANASAGFSVVTYTGTGAAGTVGHGLGVAPQLVIVKQRNAVNNWWVYHSAIGATFYLTLESTSGAAAAGGSLWNNTSPTSTVFSVGSATSNGNTLAYCFAPVAGYSAFGSYTGNAAGGPFVYTGFRPAWVMVKITSTAESWAIFDNRRSPDNLTDDFLLANASNSETANGVDNMDFLSNGFKLRGTNGMTNGSYNYIYAAFAQSPFQYSRAR